MNRSIPHALTAALLLLTACGSSGSETIALPTAEATARVLKTDPGEAVSVVEAKVDGPQERVVVVGRIANVVKGYAAFTLMDMALPYCGEVKAEDCKTPWDYCCEKVETRAANALAVELRDATGKPLATPVLPDLRLLDAVKVVGKLTKDDFGNFTLSAEGVFRTERPKLPDGLRWPQ